MAYILKHGVRNKPNLGGDPQDWTPVTGGLDRVKQATGTSQLESTDRCYPSPFWVRHASPQIPPNQS